jgi:hypothetical protein
MQTDGTRPALRILGARVKKYGPATLWAGAFGVAARIAHDARDKPDERLPGQLCPDVAVLRHRQVLGARVKKYGPATLWAGAFATAAANFVGSWPWFARLDDAKRVAARIAHDARDKPDERLPGQLCPDVAVALRILGARVKKYGPATLWAGAFATAAANFVGSWPWLTPSGTMLRRAKQTRS